MPRSGSAALLAASAAPASAALGRRDEAILNYALTLEYVQDSFYSEVERIGSAARAGWPSRRGSSPRTSART